MSFPEFRSTLIADQAGGLRFGGQHELSGTRSYLVWERAVVVG
jgi:hypothetical protein